MDQGSLISIVIPAYNAEKTIAECISAVRDQRGNFFLELIVVDDGSTDRSAGVIKSFEGVKYVYQQNAGPAAARNRGFQESSGGIVFFTDSDCLPLPDWIAKSIGHFADPAIGVVSGSYEIKNTGDRLAQCIHREIIYRHLHLMPTFPRYFGSFNFAIRREVFKSVGGFDVRYRSASGEDNDLSYKILRGGHKIYFEKDSKVKHHHTSDLKKYLREQFNHGFWRARMYRDHSRMMKGDDYTFWKDIIEPPVCLLLLLFLPLVFWDSRYLGIGGMLNFCFLCFEVLCALSMGQRPFDSLFWGAIMFLRSYSRTLGFVSGLAFLFLPKFFKKN